MAIDIDQSHYNTGTAAVAGTAVTGSGTTWLGAVRKGDLYGTHLGAGVRIASVDSNTALTLAYDVPALYQAAGPYEIQRTPYDIGYLQAIEDMIRLYGVGNLPSLASLDGTGGDLGLMLDGAGSAATFALPASARAALGAGFSSVVLALLDDADAGAVLTTLGVSAFAKAILDDADAGAMMTTLGVSAFAKTILDDANAGAARTTLGLSVNGSSLVSAANYAAMRTLLGLAVGSDVQAYDAQLAALAGLTGAAGSFVRWTGASTAAMQAILGAVSQSSGVPTGALFEYGSTATGSYIRFPDGTQICWGTASLTPSAWASGSLTTSDRKYAGPLDPVLFANSFIAVPRLVVSGADGVVAGRSAVVSYYVAGTGGITNIYYTANFNGVALSPMNLDFIAFGRWF